MPGPLAGISIIEMSGIGPTPFAAMMLADHGARVISVDRPGERWDAAAVLRRSRESIVLDLKKPAAVAVLRRLARAADGLIEGYRPGVMERLGVGPEMLLVDNPMLVYGRMTGWGQTGPYARSAGHDINYIALAGVLHAIGNAGEPPVPPLNLVADFGGGGMMLAFGMVSALLHARTAGRGQVIDSAMTDGAALLMAGIWGLHAEGRWRDARGVNLLDGSAPHYGTYETLDGKFVSIGALESKFYRLLCERLGLTDAEFDQPEAPSEWPRLRERLAALIRRRSRAEWETLLCGTDACFAPVLSMSEAPGHRHNRERETFVRVDGVTQPAPAPRYSASPTEKPRPPAQPGADTDAVLRELGYGNMELESLRAEGSIA